MSLRIDPSGFFLLQLHSRIWSKYIYMRAISGVQHLPQKIVHMREKNALRSSLPPPQLSTYRALYAGLLQQLSVPRPPHSPALSPLTLFPVAPSSCAQLLSSPIAATTLSLLAGSLPARRPTRTGRSAKFRRRRRYLRQRGVRSARLNASPRG